MPIFPSPLGMLSGPTTPEQRAEALSHTKRTLLEVRDLLRELDLPLTAFETAVEIYRVQLAGIMGEQEHKRFAERERKISALRQNTERASPARLGNMLSGYCDGLDELTDEELDGVYADFVQRQKAR